MQPDPKLRQVRVPKKEKETLDKLHAEIYDRVQKMHMIVAKALGHDRKSLLRKFKLTVGQSDPQEVRPFNDCFYSDDGFCGCY